MPVFTCVGVGTFWRTFGFARELAVRGHDITMLCAGSIGQTRTVMEQKDGVTVVTFPNRWNRTQGSGYDPIDILSRYRWLKRNRTQFDIVHSFESRPTTLLPALMAKRSGALFVSDWCDWFGRGGSVEQRPNPLLRTLMRPIETVLENRSRLKANGVTVINTPLYNKAVSLGVPDEHLMVLPNGAYTDDFRPAHRQDARRTLKLPLEIPLIAYTGSLFKSDAELMVAAFSLIQEQSPSARLLMIGYTNLDLKKLYRQPDAIINTGPVSFEQLTAYVAASTIGWIPLADTRANVGRFPMKVSDFMASGRAVVVTDVGDLGTTIRDHSLGFVAEANPESLAMKVLELLSASGQRKEFERQAREAAVTVFAWSKLTNRLEQFYSHMLAN